MIRPYVDYREFRFSKLNTPEFSHVWLLLYWPLFGLGFSYVERCQFRFPYGKTISLARKGKRYHGRKTLKR